LGPEPSASTNSATWARFAWCCIAKECDYSGSVGAVNTISVSGEKYLCLVRGFGVGHRSRRETGLGRCGAITMESGAKASEAEKAICADATLSSLDGDLAAAWKRTLAEASDAGALKASQRDWLTQRDACGSDTRCLADRYHERLSVLGNARCGASVARQGLRNARRHDRRPAQ
ncbi:lysozyme inhibitor LprI family protein, partial [Burkholderia ubonensis]|uniref:lysozyme inhibitor LprI family protein n=1 Tax=Burkholderia ubonensis TaxID=101571 RepID=UPI002FC5F1C6